MKYPLTESAKEAAKSLVRAWDEGRIEQWSAYRGKTGVDIPALMEIDDVDKGVLFELANYGLLSVTRGYDYENKLTRVELLLLQELRNAVKTNFDVSPYFLTMNAVGTIVQGDLTVHPGGVMQSAATNMGNIQQSIEQLADGLIQQFGAQFLESNTELRQSIEDLRTATEANRQSKFGKVITELGRCLGHSANTATIVVALTNLVQVLSKGY